ncbi:MAG: zinc-dependent alcohol dehydrogenase, partial [Solirubrobacteraceae bacterium]
PPLLGVFTANVDTAVNVALDTPLHFGETVTVFGQGTVGLLAAQILKLAGAGSVLAVEPVARRRELSRRAGIEQVLAPETRLPERIRELTAGRGADVSIEASGAPAALQQAIDCVADEGTVVAVSWFGAKPVSLMLGERFHRGRIRLRSSQVGHIDPALGPRWDRGRRLALALSLLPRLRLEDLISHRLPFAEAAAAYQLIDEHPDQVSQLVLTYG